MGNRFYLILAAFLGFISNLQAQEVLVHRQVTLMGSVFDISIIEKDSLMANQRIDEVYKEIDRIENLISEWRPQTQISQVNREAGIRPVKVDAEVFELTKRAIAYSKMSNGAFDISIMAMDRIWKFDGSMTTMPTPAAVQQSIVNVGYQDIVLDSVASTIFLRKVGMKIGFGSIGKGYAADRGRTLMQEKHVKGGIVNASGDLATWGKQPNGKAWTVGITNPFNNVKLIKVLKLKESAVATSGSYEKYAEIDGKRYSHIINPKTGYPASGLTSVTIYGPSAEFCNALSTSVMVLGKEAGIALVKAYPQYRYVLLSDEGKVYSSR